MGYRGNSIMDCGYYVGGDPRGLLYFPPENSPDYNKDKPVIIPWNSFDENGRLKEPKTEES